MSTRQPWTPGSTSRLIKNENPDELTDAQAEAAYIATLAIPAWEPTAITPKSDDPIIPTSQGKKQNLSDEAQREVDYYLNLGK